MKIGNNGITLVALIITIIVLLILATVSISLIINSGILDKAQHGIDKYSEEEELEQIKLAVYSATLKGNGFLTTENLNSELHERIDENEDAEKTENIWYYKGYAIEGNGNVEKHDKLLPKEFQQVEYIESTGTQWIDTKLNKATPNTQIKIKFSVSKQKSFHCLFCCRTATTNSRTLFITDLNGFRNDQNRTQIGLNASLNLNTVYTIDSTPLHLKFNDIILNEYTKDSGIEIENQFTIFNCNDYRNMNTMSNEYGFEGKVYYYKIYDNYLIRDFIPCYCTTTVTNVDGDECDSGTIGLYDMVEGKFYTNKGSGYFIPGPAV